MKRIMVITVFMVCRLFPQDNVATTSAAFLEIGAGARSLSMGGAYAAVSDDATALYWNPAGIVNIMRPTVQTYYAPWLVDTEFYFGSSVIPMGTFGTLGFSYTAITMDEMMVRTVQNPEPNEYGERFDAGSLALGIAYAKSLTDRFSFGFQTKFVQETIWQMQAKGLAVDIGTLFITKSGIRIGMSISNFGDKMGMGGTNTLVDHDIDETIYGNNEAIDAHLDAAKWPLPLLFRFGLSKELTVSPRSKILVAADAVHPNNNPEYINAGVEFNLWDLIFLRAGQSHLLYKQSSFMIDEEEITIDPLHGVSIGFGLNYQIPRGPKIRIDYVHTDFGIFNSVSGYSINFSF